MEKARLSDLPRAVNPLMSHHDRRPVSEHLGTEAFTLNYYELEPGDSMPGKLHTHADQEEVFFVLDGCVTFRRLGGPVEVRADEAVRFAPGEFHEGVNDREATARVLAMGAPDSRHDWSAITVRNDCEGCGRTTDQSVVDFGRSYWAFECPDCGATWREP